MRSPNKRKWLERTTWRRRSGVSGDITVVKCCLMSRIYRRETEGEQGWCKRFRRAKSFCFLTLIFPAKGLLPVVYPCCSTNILACSFAHWPCHCVLISCNIIYLTNFIVKIWGHKQHWSTLALQRGATTWVMRQISQQSPTYRFPTWHLGPAQGFRKTSVKDHEIITRIGNQKKKSINQF